MVPQSAVCGRTTGFWVAAQTFVPGETLVISHYGQTLGSALFNGYAYPYIGQDLLASELPYLSYLAPFTYGITASGGLLPLADDDLLSAARQRGVRPVMHLSTLTEDGQFDTERGALVLTDQAVQTQLITEIQQTLRRRLCRPGCGF